MLSLARIFTLLASFAIAPSIVWAAQAQVTLTIAKPSQAYPPYHWQLEYDVVGLLPEIINLTATSMENVTIKYISVPWKRMFELAKEGKIDAIMPVNRNAEREAYLNFVDEPLVMEQMSFVSSSAYQVNFNGDITSLTNYEVAGIAGYYYGEEYASANFTTIELPNEETQVKMLLAGRFPLALLDTNILPYYINKLGGEKPYQIKILTPSLNQTGLHLAFSKKSQHAAIAATFSAALKKLKPTPSYQNIIARHLSH